MGKYVVNIVERLVKNIVVEATDKDDAVSQAMALYRAKAIVLTADDFDGDTIFTANKID